MHTDTESRARIRTIVPIAAILLASVTPALAIDEYVIDDGTGEINVTAGNIPTNLVFVNQFNVVQGDELITDIRIAWGDIPQGTPFTLLIFDDPNDDGNPGDITPADVLFSGPGVTGVADTDVFTEYPVPNVNAGNTGDSFFIGACVSHPETDEPARIDLDTASQQSWFAFDLPGTNCNDPNALQIPFQLLDDFGFPGTFMIRANAIVDLNNLVWNGVMGGGSEVPPVATDAVGLAVVELNESQTELSFEITFAGLSSPEIAAHFHNAPPGVNGPAVFTLPLGSPKTGVWNIPPAMVTELAEGRMYVNIHSEMWPDGEIRGDLEPFSDPTPTVPSTWTTMKSRYR